MTETNPNIFKPDKNDVPKIVGCLSDAFYDYPVMRYILDDDLPDYEKKLEILINFFVMARIFRDEIILGIGNRTYPDGVALISNPAKIMIIPELSNLREQVWQELGSTARSRYEAFGQATANFPVDQPHIKLNMIGVRSLAQGLGYGRRLMDEVQRISASDPESTGVSLTTEVQQNVSFYEHMGYKITGYTRINNNLETWGFFRPE